MPCPLAIVALEGAVHKYEVAFTTGAIEYATPFAPAHTPFTGPVTVPGVAVSELIESVRAALVPQAFPDFTLNVPDTNDAP